MTKCWHIDKVDIMTDGQVDKMTGWQNDRLTKLTYWQSWHIDIVDRLTKWQVDTLINWQVNTLTCWQVECWTNLSNQSCPGAYRPLSSTELLSPFVKNWNKKIDYFLRKKKEHKTGFNDFSSKYTRDVHR